MLPWCYSTFWICWIFCWTYSTWFFSPEWLCWKISPHHWQCHLHYVGWLEPCLNHIFGHMHFVIIFGFTTSHHMIHVRHPLHYLLWRTSWLESTLCFWVTFYALPPWATQWDKLHSNTWMGIFLGYSQTMKTSFTNHVSHQVKTALHIIFDEAMTDSDLKTPMHVFYAVTPSYLWRSLTLPPTLHVSIFPCCHSLILWPLRCPSIRMTLFLLALRLPPVDDYIAHISPPFLVHQLAILCTPTIAHLWDHTSSPFWISLSFMLLIWISSFIIFALRMNFPLAVLP